jgi:hypothetical protein
MLKRIYFNDILYSIIIKANYSKKEGIDFFTPDDFSQQLAYIKRPKNHEIPPHVHNPVKREVTLTKEILYIKKGKVRVDFYTENKEYIKSTILETGDVILLAKGGHGFKMIEPSEIIEVKQGPYVGELDKTRFDAINDDQVIIDT